MSELQQLPSLLRQLDGISIDQSLLIPLKESTNSWWLRLKAGTRSLEGKLFLPQEKSEKLIIFEPGFPGGGSTDFEKLHVRGLLAEGFTLFTARHNGSILNGQHSAYYINCPERQERALDEKQETLGENEQYTIRDWLDEPLMALECLMPGFQQVILAGHSFGALAMLWSVIELFKHKTKTPIRIKRLLSLAGATGRIRSPQDQILKTWREHIDTDWTRERIQIGDPEANLSYLKDAYDRLHSQAHTIPDIVSLVFVSPWGDTADRLDELTTPQEALDIIVTLGRGTLVIDKTQHGEPDLSQLAHDMGALQTATLLKFVDPAWLPSKQILRLDDTGIT